MVHPMLVCSALQPALDRPQRAGADCHINAGAYVRVHLHPKRFPAAHTWDWKVSCCRLQGSALTQPPQPVPLPVFTLSRTQQLAVTC